MCENPARGKAWPICTGKFQAPITHARTQDTDDLLLATADHGVEYLRRPELGLQLARQRLHSQQGYQGTMEGENVKHGRYSWRKTNELMVKHKTLSLGLDE